MKEKIVSEYMCEWVYKLAKSKINESPKNPPLHEMKKKIENEMNEHHVFIYIFPFHGYGKN